MSNEYNGKKRSELPDSVFGIPQERKYPMPDEKHTRSAIKLFNHVDPKYEEQLAKAVIKNMKKYRIDGSVVGPNNRLRKYLPKDMIKESTIIPPICSFEKEPIHEYKPIPGSGILSVIRPISQKDKNDIQHIMNNLDGFEDFVFKNICFYDIERHNQTPIGFVILRKRPELHTAFASIGVTEEYRGSGIGSKLLEKAISYFKSTKDIIWLEYWVDVNNQASITLAEKSGFTKYLSNNTSRSLRYYKYYMKNDNNLCEQIQESSHKSDFSYSGIKTSAEKSEFKRDFREVFKEDPTESSINYMQMIKYKGSLVGYIGFSRYKEGKKKYLGIGNFMIIKRYQHSGIGSKVISDIIDRYKDNYDEIYCYVDKDNTSAIAFYKKIAKVNTDNLTRYGYYVTLYKKGSTNESYLLQEVSIPEEIPNDIRELLRRLNSYDYGYIKNGQKIKGMKNFFEDYKSLTISEFEKYQIGVCWDYVHYEAYWFAKNHYKYETFYIQVQDEDNDCPSHTYLVFYLPNSSKVYYFESSWGKYQGIEAFDNIIKLQNTIKERHIESAKSKCDPKTYFRNKYDAKSSRWEHLSCGDYMVKVSNGKVQINESSSILPQNTGITTVIFDIGDVLVSANIKDYLVADPEVPNEIVDELLKLWFIDKDEVDDTMDLDTYREIVNKRMGTEFSKYIPKLFRYNVECVTAFDYTIPMIQDLKDKGYKVYYLSNWSAWTHDLLQEAGKFDFLKLMDGGVFSYDVGYMKPDEEIYKILLNKYKINPEEAIFFDDREENIEAANKMGIHGVHFPRHDSSIVYNSLKVLQTSNEMANEVATSRVVLTKEIIQEELAKYSIAIENQHMIAKASIKVIEPVILNNNKYRKQAKDLDLRLRCDLLPVKGTTINIRVLDRYQICEDPGSAKQLLDDIKESCVTVANKLSGTFRYYVEEVTTDDKGCLNFHIKKMKVVSYNSDNEVMKEEDMEYPDFPVVLNIDSDITTVDIDKTLKESSIQEYGTTGGTIVGANQPDSVYIVNYMQNNVFSGYKEPKQAICKKGMNQMYTTKNGKAIPVDIDKFKEEASDISVFRFKETPILSFDKIIENASVDGDFYMLLTGDYPTNQHEIEYDNRFVQEENFFDKLDNITYCTESTIIGQIEATDYPYMKILTESMEGRCWNYYRDINGVFAMNELTGLRTPSYEDITDIPNSQIQLIERGTVYFGD